jgi:mRNA interferase MazF
MTKAFVPDAGDIVWIDFSPRQGREQAGRRPAVVLSPASYNSMVGLMVCCPTTTRIKGFPFEVLIAGDPPSVALADHVKSLDWRQRNAQPKARAHPAELDEIRAKIAALLQL